MGMHAAAIPPRQPFISETDRSHPAFAEYQAYRSSMTKLYVQAASFGDWLHQQEKAKINLDATSHALYPAFIEWMKANKGGARRCPAGDFPHNFTFWLEGGRW